MKFAMIFATHALVLLLGAAPALAQAQALAPHQQLAKDIYKELMEINTVTATGDTLKAAQAMAARILVKSFFEGSEYLYRLMKALSSGAR